MNWSIRGRRRRSRRSRSGWIRRSQTNRARQTALARLLLAVVRAFAVLAQVMLVYEIRVGAWRIGREQTAAPFHARDEFQHARVLNGVRGVRAPGERRMIRDQHRRHVL